MIFTHILAGLGFYLAFSLFALVGLPLTSRIFQSKLVAYVTAKMAGLVVFGYAIWLLASFQLISYQDRALVLGLFLACGAVGAYLSRNFLTDDTPSPAKGGKKSHAGQRPFGILKKIILLEAATVGAYVLYLLLRSHNSDINGTERFMDLALTAAAGRTDHFPFIDPWYAGKTVNYYYYGAYLLSLINKLAGLPVALAYNLMLGLVFVQTAVLTAALGTALSGLKKVGFLAAFLVTCAGTLYYAGCSMEAALSTPPGTCSYASSTRLYTPSYIINEIPSYSFTVGDLHAHLLALPFLAYSLLLVYAFMRNPRVGWALAGLLAVSYATSGMTNAWDLVTLACLLAVAAVFRHFRTANMRDSLRHLAVAGGVVGAALLLMVPNLVKFQSPVLGLGFAPSYVKLYELSGVQWPTPLLALLGMWGAPLAGIAVALIVKRRLWRQYLFPLALVFLSVGIIVGVEVFFIRDIYSVSNPPFFRANTTFKFGYHAWVMLSLAFAALVLPIRAHRDSSRYGASSKINIALVILAVTGGLFYPYQAVKQFYLSRTEPVTLNGSDWMRMQMPDDLAAINYINTNIPGRPVIAEAVGDSYTTYSRIATYTGVTTPMGWTTHEWTWRLDADAAKQAAPGKDIETGWGEIAQVMGDMETLYGTTDPALARQIADKYGVEYIYVGELERQKYPALNEGNIRAVSEPVFESGSSTLYRIAR